MILRFQQGIGLVAKDIILQEKTAMPFTPSHVEALLSDGYLGAHIDGGVQVRPVGYDKNETAHELLLTLDATPEQDEKFEAFLRTHIGEPYDWKSIIGFIVPGHMHIPNHVICSALQTLALRAAGWFKWPLAAPAHLIDPRDLLLMLSARMEVPGI